MQKEGCPSLDHVGAPSHKETTVLGVLLPSPFPFPFNILVGRSRCRACSTAVLRWPRPFYSKDDRRHHRFPRLGMRRPVIEIVVPSNRMRGSVPTPALQ